jgi:hypothetical protein
MITIARTRLKRKQFDNKASAFRVNKQPVKETNTNRFLKRKNISDGILLSMASPVNGEPPLANCVLSLSHIHC